MSVHQAPLTRRGQALSGPPPMLLRLVAILIVPLAVYALYATGQKALQNYALNQEAARVRTEVGNLREENIRLQEMILQARTDTAIEGVAREQLGLAKPGDHPVTLPAATNRPSAPLRIVATPEPAPPVWRQWWDTFFGNPPG